MWIINVNGTVALVEERVSMHGRLEPCQMPHCWKSHVTAQLYVNHALVATVEHRKYVYSQKFLN